MASVREIQEWERVVVARKSVRQLTKQDFRDDFEAAAEIASAPFKALGENVEWSWNDDDVFAVIYQGRTRRTRFRVGFPAERLGPDIERMVQATEESIESDRKTREFMKEFGMKVT